MTLFPLPRWTYFASGSNHAGEVEGFGDIGHPVGLTIADARAEAIEAARHTPVPVFVDSGAFGEVEITNAGPIVKRPISDDDWRARLARMLVIARRPRGGVSVVAPDRVGDQGETLARLRRFLPELGAFAEAGARVLLPVQRGAMPMPDFWATAQRVVAGVCSPVPALPMKKAATSPAELAAFARAVAPDDIHLLGIGPASRRWCGALEALAFTGCAHVSADSVLILAHVGRSNGRGGAPRLLTAASDTAAEVVAGEAWGGGVAGLDDYTDAVSDPESWMTPDEVEALRAETGAPADIALGEWLGEDAENGEPRALLPEVAAFVDAAWLRYREDQRVRATKRLAIVVAFGGRG